MPEVKCGFCKSTTAPQVVTTRLPVAGEVHVISCGACGAVLAIVPVAPPRGRD